MHSNSNFPCKLGLLNRFLRSGIRRKLLCIILILTLLILPNSDLTLRQLPVMAATTVEFAVGVNSWASSFWNWLFGAKPSRRQRESLTDRIARVSTIRLTPSKIVGYQGDVVTLNALPSDLSGNTVQGVRFSWESSDTTKLQVDQTGKATFLNAGLVQIICRAGLIEARAWVLIKQGERPVQTDEQWEADQNSLTESGSTIGGAATVLDSVFSNLIPTVSANDGGCTSGGDSTDFGYDELWSEPRNLTGSPRNRVLEPSRIGPINPEGSNFNMSIPIYSLGGRGLGASLTLYYNSRVWSRHGSAVTFNAVNGWPFAGFSLGFGRIFTYGSGSSTKYVWVAPDGTRHYLGTGSDTTGATYETSDGSHITFVGSKTFGGSLYFNNGTKVTITVTNNRLLPTRIRDSNGNYISISYKVYNSVSFPWRQAIDYVTDTLGRILQFQYDDCDNLVLIQVPKFNDITARDLVRFDYNSVSISNSFSGLTVENRPTVQVPALRHIYFPDTNAGYKFDYSVYGMIYNVSMRKDMAYTSGTGVISDGTEKAAVNFNYPTTASSLTDTPAFTQRQETATNSPTSTYTYSTSTGTGTKTFTITRPDSSQRILTRSTTTGITDGLLIESQIKNSSSVTMAKSVFAYTTDGGGDPQVQSVINYDDVGTPTKIEHEYDSYGNITNSREYGHQISSNWQVRRRTRRVYKTDTAYINAYLRSLVLENNIYDALENTSDGDDVMISKTTITYDDYSAMSGMEDYSGQQMPPNHESSFNTTVTVRGNVTGTTVYKDIAASQTIIRLKKYDIFGNVVKEQLGCCNEREYTRVEDNGYTAPISTMSGVSSTTLSTSMEDEFNTGLVEETTDPQGDSTSYTYDAALRSDTATSHTGATQEANHNDSALTSSQTANWTEGVTSKSATTSYTYDGWGRVIRVTTPNGSKTDTTYDSMSRVLKRSNPYTGTAPGIDTEYTYDALGRTTIAELPDGQTVQTSYSGTTVTVTDPVNRQIKRESDGLGRVVKVYEQTSAGALTQETTYTYDLMDRLKEVNQGGQLRKYKYDDLGRLLFERIPEQAATINDGTGTMWSCKYTYTDFDAAATRTDARGVITTYSYDDLHRLTGISYNVSGATGVASTPTVSYNYSTAGATKGLLSSVTVGGLASAGGYEENYSYDANNMLSSIGHKFNTGGISTRTYTTAYEYTTAEQTTELTYPSSRVLKINHDSLGRLSSIVNDSDSTNYLSSISYSTAGQTSSWTLGSNIAESFGYDTNRLQLTSQTVTQNSSTRLSLTYSYSASAGQMGSGSTAGNAGQLMSVTGSIGGQTESASYTYDNIGRLVTSSQTSNGVSASRRFEYDRWGNRTGVWNATSGGTQIQSVSLEQSNNLPTNRITSVTEVGTLNYTYDSAGNVTNDGIHSYTYDAENRPVSIDSGTTASYNYDHQNRRVKKVVSSTTTHYVWEGSQCLAEHNGSTGTVIAEYIYAGSRMIAREQSGRIFFLKDKLSTRATITDGQGGIQGRQSHLPFGEELNATGTTDKHRFTNYERDSESGLDYALNRGYSSGIGRFAQSDPYRASGGPNLPQSWNRYTYTHNNPSNKVDPSGLDDEEPHDAGEIDSVIVRGGWDYIIPITEGGFNLYPFLPVELYPRPVGDLIPQRPRPVRPTPQRLGKAKFSEQKFRDCMHQLFDNGRPERTQAIDEFLNSRHLGTDQPYGATFNYDRNAKDLGDFLRSKGVDVKGDQIAGYARATPDIIYFANDVFPPSQGGVLGQGEFGAAILFHEITNWYQWTVGNAEPNRDTLPGGGYGQRNPNDKGADPDAGAAVEECMYGGFVHSDGYIWNVPRSRP